MFVILKLYSAIYLIIVTMVRFNFFVYFNGSRS